MRAFSLTTSVPAALSCLLIAFGSSEARIINVPEDHETIQDGIDASEDGDTVLVQPGLYRESISFNGLRIVVGSLILLTDDPAYIDSTIIDGSEQVPCVVFRSGETSQSKLRGFTLQNGRQSYGGGIDCQHDTFPELLDLHITNTVSGGGIHCSSNSRPLIKNCIIDQNVGHAMGGGGISIYGGGFPTIVNCQITDNISTYGQGGGIWLWGSKAEIIGCEIARNEAYECGGIWVDESDTLIIRDSNIHHNRITEDDCVIGGLRVDGGNIRGGKTHLIIDHTIIANNTAYENGAFLIEESAGQLSNLTVVGNESGQLGSGALRFCDLAITNSIFYFNENPFVLADNEGEVIVDYCDVEDSTRSFLGDVDWGENNLSLDPLFTDAENQDYSLTRDSPCVNSGGPEAPNDPDGTRSDIGAITYINTIGWISGQVFDGITGDPLPGLEVSADHGGLVFGDSSGVWHYRVFGIDDSTEVNLVLTVPGYARNFVDTVVYLGDSLWLETPFFVSRFIPSVDEIICEVDSNSFLRMTLRISNDQPGTLNWTGTTRTSGSAGLPLMGLRDSLHISQITNDERIEGAAFDGEKFYIAGANDNEDNLIYMIDREGALLDSFPQVGSSRYGYKDIDFDGEHLWAVGEDSVYCLTTEGEVVERWPDTAGEDMYIAYDRVDDIVWMSGTTSSIYAFDPHGNNLGRVLARSGLRIYGLGCAENDSDNARLYIVNKPITNNSASKITKMNTETGDTLFVGILTTEESSTGYHSSFVCDNYDRYQCTVLMTIDNISSIVGGDRLDIYQLYPNDEWLTIDPTEGAVPANGQMEVDILARSVGELGDWRFGLGFYEGEIVFANDSPEGEVVIPVTMRVVEPGEVGANERIIPQETTLSAYPNPFNPTLTIKYSTESINGRGVSLKVYGIDGRMVEDFTIARDPQSSVDKTVVWDAGNLPGGIYLTRLEAGNEVKTMKIILLK